MLLWIRYKIDPYQFESHLSIEDLQVAMEQCYQINEADRKEYQKDNKQNMFIKSLVAIRNILNNMKLPDSL